MIGEAGRLPDLARAYFETVTECSYASLAELLKGLGDEGKLTLNEPLAAAHQFACLTLGWPLDRAMFFGADA